MVCGISITQLRIGILVKYIIVSLNIAHCLLASNDAIYGFTTSLLQSFELECPFQY